MAYFIICYMSLFCCFSVENTFFSCAQKLGDSFGRYETTTTTTTTTVLRPFARDYPGESVPEESLIHPPSWASSNLYQLLQLLLSWEIRKKIQN